MNPVSQAAQQQTQQPDPTQNPQVVPGAVQSLQNQVHQGAQTLDAERQQQDQQAATNPVSSAARAMALLNPDNNSKDSQANTMSKVGGALNTKNYSGLCLQYVDDQTGNKDRSPTAYADYQKNAASGDIKTSGTPPKGARVYFAPTPDNPAGHVGLSDGSGNFTGATTSQGIKTFSIKDWEKYSNQQYIGWAPPNSK